MNNFVSLVVALLEHAEVLTEKEAEVLIKELHGLTIPDNYKACTKLVEDLFKKLEIKSIPSKLGPSIKTAIDPFIAASKVVPATPAPETPPAKTKLTA